MDKDIMELGKYIGKKFKDVNEKLDYILDYLAEEPEEEPEEEGTFEDLEKDEENKDELYMEDDEEIPDYDGERKKIPEPPEPPKKEKKGLFKRKGKKKIPQEDIDKGEF